MSSVEKDNEDLVGRAPAEEASRLTEDRFSEAAWWIVEGSLAQAKNLGNQQIGLTAFILAMIHQSDEGEDVEGFEKLTESLRRLLGKPESSTEPIELSLDCMTGDVQRILCFAYELAESEHRRIEPGDFWRALLAESPNFVKGIIERFPFQIDLENLGEEETNHEEAFPSVDDWNERLWPVMRQALQAEDLTFLALSDRLPPAIERSFAEGEVYEKIARTLYRSKAKHVLLTADRGVGKTTVLRELARRAAQGRYPFLDGKRFLRLDCSAVPPEDGRAVLERVVQEVGDWENLILCLDGLGPLLKRSADNLAFLRPGGTQRRSRFGG